MLHSNRKSIKEFYRDEKKEGFSKNNLQNQNGSLTDAN